MAHTRRTVAELRRAFGGRVALVRHDMGITGFGVQLFDSGPATTARPSTTRPGAGKRSFMSGWVAPGGSRLTASRSSWARDLVAIPPGTRRKVRVGAEGLRYLCVGGVPGGATSRARSSIVPARPAGA